MVLAIVQQRDMYRGLLAQYDQRYSQSGAAGGGPDGRASATPVSTSLVPSTGSSAGLEAVLKSTQDELIRVRSESRATELQYRDEVDKLKREMAEVCAPALVLWRGVSLKFTALWCRAAASERGACRCRKQVPDGA